MKRFTRAVCMILAFAMVMAVPVYAADTRGMDASHYFSYTSAYLAKVSGTTFRFNFQVNGLGIMDEIGVSYLEIQESSNDSDWDTVATYTDLLAYGTSTHLGYFTYTGTANKYYRAYVEFYASNDSGSGYYTYYTSSIKVP